MMLTYRELGKSIIRTVILADGSAFRTDCGALDFKIGDDSNGDTQATYIRLNYPVPYLCSLQWTRHGHRSAFRQQCAERQLSDSRSEDEHNSQVSQNIAAPRRPALQY